MIGLKKKCRGSPGILQLYKLWKKFKVMFFYINYDYICVVNTISVTQCNSTES